MNYATTYHSRYFVLLNLLCWQVAVSSAQPPEYLMSAQRILFMGDSITHAGHYVNQLESQFRLRHSGQSPEMINLGLSSETCCGLSEPAHPFPRPNVHERLQRALERVKPDVVVVCYGMNDGIYHPFSRQRFAAFQEGVCRMIKKIQNYGAHLILMSPPPFDPKPLRPTGKLRPLGAEQFAWFAIYEKYDDVLARYTCWILQQRDEVDMVIDLYTPIKEYVEKRRKSDPEFTASPDGIHLSREGHRLLAATILSAWGMGELRPIPPPQLKLVAQRQSLLHHAWLSHVGHQRPGIKPGLPLEQAIRNAHQIEASIVLGQ